MAVKGRRVTVPTDSPVLVSRGKATGWIALRLRNPPGATVNLGDDAVETTTGFEVAEGEEVPMRVVATNALGMAAKQERVFIATTGLITVAVTDNLRATFDNPSGSGRTCRIVRLVGENNEDALVDARLYIDPDTGLPSTGHSPLNTVIGSTVSPVGVVNADAASTALSGGTETDIHFVIPKGRTEIDLQVPIIVPPGTVLGLNMPVGVSVEGQGGLGVYWYEEDV